MYEMLDEILNNKNFNSYLNKTLKVTKIGSLIIYIFFIISILINKDSYKATVWISLIFWITLIMISMNNSIKEKFLLSVCSNKNNIVVNDINYIKNLLVKYKIDDLKEIKNYLESKLKNNNKISDIATVVPILFILTLLILEINMYDKIITIFINQFVIFITKGLSTRIQYTYLYIYHCIINIMSKI